MSDTPETDHLENELGQAARMSHPILWAQSRKLERERDEAREAFVIATDQMVIAQGKVREANKERDEALNTNFEEISNKLVVAISERDEARGRAKELSELVDGAYIIVELDKPQGEYNKKWREAWLEKAKRLIPGVDSIWY